MSHVFPRHTKSQPPVAVGGEGCYLIDREGQRYLDFLSGFGVFALGRSHPVLKQTLADALEADLPGLVQMDCALLPGLVAKALLDEVIPMPSMFGRITQSYASR